MRIRLICGALLGLAVALHASAAAPPGPPTFYASSLPLQQKDIGMTEGDQLQFFCTGSHAHVDPLRGSIPVCGNDRLEATRGTTIEVDYVYVESHRGDCADAATSDVTLTGSEVARKTLIAKEVSEIVTAITSHFAPAAVPAAAAASPPPPHVCVVRFQYVLKLERATATLAVASKAEADVKASQPLVTGPEEHWFITGDAIVRGVKELKYDAASKTVVQRDKPQQFYVGFNYMVGDVLERYPQFSGRRTVFKLMLSPTKNPFDSIGAGVGYRLVDGVFQLPDAKSDSTSQGDISGGLVLFVGHFWSKNDRVDAATGAVTQGGRSQSWRFGLSYDVATLLGWLN